MRRLSVHALLLVIVLAVGVAVSSPGVAFVSDEGAVMIEARLLQRNHSWIEANPFPTVDPLGRARTIPNGDIGTKGHAPYAKHPLYPALVAVADGVAGFAGVAALGVLGAVLAALAAAAIAGRLEPRLRLWALWLTGLGTPLVFDTGIVVAHTLAAAAVGLAGYAALRCLDDTTRRRAAWAVAVAAGVLAATGLRTEGAIAGAALAVAGAVAALRGTSRRGLLVAATAGGAVLLGRTVERIVVRAAIGGPAVNNSPASSSLPTGLHARLSAFVQSWLQPVDHGPVGVRVSLTVAVVAVGVAAIASRRRPDLVGPLVVLAVGAFIVRVALGPAQLIPGLLIAFPAGCFALLAVRRSDVRDHAAAFLAVAIALFSAGVLATQYADAGGPGWGGRYFAIGLPLAVPLVCVVFARVASAAPSRVLVSGFAAASAVVAFVAWGTLARTHRATNAVRAAMRDDAKLTMAAGGRPVVVTPDVLLPQIEWPDYFKYQWLAPVAAELQGYESRLAGSGVHSLVLVTLDPDHDLSQTSPYRISERRTVSGLTLAVLTLGGS